MITRQIDNVNRLIDWSDAVANIDPTYGWAAGSGLFNVKTTSQDAIMFEKTDFKTILLNPTSRRERNTQKMNARSSKMYALPMPYFNVQEHVTRADLQGHIQKGTESTPETEQSAIAEKLEIMRNAYDMTREYMSLSAIKGLTVAPNGDVLADMFAEFNLTQEVIEWPLLTDPDFDVRKACRELKSKLQRDLRTGGRIRAVEVVVGEAFFDALINHPQVVAAHYAYAMPDRAYYMDGGLTFQTFGVQNVFEFQGIRFLTYDASFNLPNEDGTFTNVEGIEAEVGHTVIRGDGLQDLYRVYYGTNNKLSGANSTGQELFSWSYRDDRDTSIDLELEFSHLYFCTQPQVQKKLVLEI
jgi:hypothetical protein